MADMNTKDLLRQPEELENLSKPELLDLSYQLFKKVRDVDPEDKQYKTHKEGYNKVAELLAGDLQEEENHDPDYVLSKIKDNYRGGREKLSFDLSLHDIYNSSPVKFEKKPEASYDATLSDKVLMLIKKLQADPAVPQKSKLDFYNLLRHEQEQEGFKDKIKETPDDLLEKYGRTTEDRFNYLSNLLKKDLVGARKEKAAKVTKVLRVSHDYNRNTGGLQQHLQELNQELGGREDIEIHQALPIGEKDFQKLLDEGVVEKIESGYKDVNSGTTLHPIFLGRVSTV